MFSIGIPLGMCSNTSCMSMLVVDEKFTIRLLFSQANIMVVAHVTGHVQSNTNILSIALLFICSQTKKTSRVRQQKKYTKLHQICAILFGQCYGQTVHSTITSTKSTHIEFK